MFFVKVRNRVSIYNKICKGNFFLYIGRLWRKDELRIKSNEDLYKLW